MANALTVARIALVLPFAWLFFVGASWAMKAALAIFVIAALTDFLDGWIARALKQTSALGAALDPLADKLLVAAALVLLVRNGVIRDAGVVAALIILMREIFVMGLREAIAVAGRALPVTGLAKWKTAAQLIAVSLLLASAPGGLVGEPARASAAAALWFAAILTLWTGADYAVRGLKALKGAPR